MTSLTRSAARTAAALIPTAALLVAGCVRQPAPAATPAPARGAQSGAAAGPAGGPGAPGAPSDSTRRPGGPASAIKPYNQVITKEAKSRAGMFSTHIVSGKLFFEIPDKELNKDMLMVGRLTRAGASDPRRQAAYVGDQFAERTLRWERNGNKVLLRSPSFDITADSNLSVYKAVLASNNAPIIAIFDVAAYGKDSAAVIDVTNLYLASPAEFAAMRGRVDDKRSYIERAVAFPDNVEVEATQTVLPQGTPGGSSDPVSVIAHWSMVRLPERPMMPRLVDDRVGFFDVSQVDFGTTQFRSVEKRYIARYRLEKKDPNAELSEPVKPIIYYIDPATPDQWKPYIKAAVEEWQPAFEAAGFKKGIVAMDPPNDPDWSMEDVRNTVIRWLPSTTENAQGPHVSDPRTGEILNGSIRMFHNILNLQRSWYFTQVAPLDPRAQTWPMPDSLMGRLIQYVVAHEIGHTLGLYHNHKSSSTYPADSVRSRTWVEKMGHVASIMDYSRFNYVAQPEDSIPVQYLIPTVGPYDKFAIMWGYKPIPGARTPDEERPTLNSWARMQDTIPWLRFGRAAETGLNGNPDYGDQMEAVGDADAIKSTALGVKNIKRIMPMLIPVTVKSGEDYSDLREIYGRLVGQWAREMSHVAAIVGASEVRTVYGGQASPAYRPIPRQRQADAVKFLNANVFTTPTFLVDERVSELLEPNGALNRINGAQNSILGSLLSGGRLGRMVEYEALAKKPADVYTVRNLISDLHDGIWSELQSSNVHVDAWRRNLQRSYISQFGNKINPPPPPPNVNPLLLQMMGGGSIAGDALDAMRAHMVALREEVSRAIPRAADAATRAHLTSVRKSIDEMLDPKK